MIRGLWFLLLMTSLCFGGEQVTDKKFGFSFTVPGPFKSSEVDKQTSPNAIHVLMDRENTPEDIATVLQVERLRGLTDPNKHVTLGELPKMDGVSSSLELFSWGGFKLDLLRQEITQPDAPTMVSYTMQFPLRPEAIQILAAGPLKRESDVRKALEVFAADFKSLSPLTTGKSESAAKEPPLSSERGTKMAGGIFKLTITALVVLIIIRAIVAAVRGKKKSG